MPEHQWHLPSAHLQSDMRFQLALLLVHRRIHERHFAKLPYVNASLGFHLHDYRRLSGWRAVLILTPWMLSRLLFPEVAPGISIPDGWSAEARRDASYLIPGPAVQLTLNGVELSAHLNYQALLGHYLMQPIDLDMRRYETPHAAFEANRETIQRQDDSLRQMLIECA